MKYGLPPFAPVLASLKRSGKDPAAHRSEAEIPMVFSGPGFDRKVSF